MEEREVLTKLGFNSEDELKNVEQLRKYTLRYATDKDEWAEKKLKDIYILKDKDSVASKELIDNYLKVLTTDQPLLPMFYYGKPAGWRAYLDSRRKKQAIQDSESKDKSEEKKEKCEPPYFKFKPEPNPKTYAYNLLDKGSGGGEYRIDRGHLLGVFADSFFSFKYFLDKKRQATPNHFNEYPQFLRANEGFKSSIGQQFFEGELSKNNTKTFYYEVEAVYAKPKDKIPIGTRLRIVEIALDGTNDIQHVFIPNCDRAGSDADAPCDVDKAHEYQKYFQDGDVDKLFGALHIHKDPQKQSLTQKEAVAMAKRYYAVYTGTGNGEVMHCVWAEAEDRVADLLRGNAKARHRGFDSEEVAINFAKTGKVDESLMK